MKFLHLFIRECGGDTNVPCYARGSQKTTRGKSVLSFYDVWSQGSSSCDQAQQQATLPAEPLHWPRHGVLMWLLALFYN